MNNLLYGRYSALLFEYLNLNVREALAHIQPLLPVSADHFPDDLRLEAEKYLAKRHNAGKIK